MNKIKIGLQLFLGGMFLLSAYSKLIAPGIFEILLIENGIFDNRQMAGLFTTIIIGSELAIGFLLLQPNYLKKIIIPVTILILSIFTVHLVYSGFVLGDSENCGCFGELIQMSSVESSIKNIIVIAAAFFLYRLIKTERNNLIPPIIILITSFIIAFTFAPIRDINSFQFKDYTYFESRGRIDLTSNEILLGSRKCCKWCPYTVFDKNRFDGIKHNFKHNFSSLSYGEIINLNYCAQCIVNMP